MDQDTVTRDVNPVTPSGDSEQARPGGLRGRLSIWGGRLAGRSRNRRSLLRDMPVARKLTIITIMLLLPLVLVGTYYVRDSLSSILFTRAEMKGLELGRPLDGLLQMVERHGVVVGQGISQTQAASEDIGELNSAIDASIGWNAADTGARCVKRDCGSSPLT